MPDYWVFDAPWVFGQYGVEYGDQKFIDQGIWMLGWEPHERSAQYEKASKIKSGDRIAIMKGIGQTGIKICHLGIIKGVILEANKVICTVDWVANDLNRSFEKIRECSSKLINGPFEHDEWIEKVFCL